MKLKKEYIAVIFLIMTISSNMNAQHLYFSSPEESVEKISKLLIQENWNKLVKYYYTDETSDETLDSMKNGSYFIRTKKPESFHPGLSWKYKKPFSPSFKYSHHEIVEGNLIKVIVYIEIDQGDGMIQRGLSYFYLLKVEKGYLIKP
jgi:hypothetical protein